MRPHAAADRDVRQVAEDARAEPLEERPADVGAADPERRVRDVAERPASSKPKGSPLRALSE